MFFVLVYFRMREPAAVSIAPDALVPAGYLVFVRVKAFSSYLPRTVEVDSD